MWPSTTLCLLGLVIGYAFADYIEDPSRMPGWRGELPSSLHAELRDSVGYGELGEELWRGRIEQVSWEPRAYVLHGFLSDDECDHIIALSAKSLRKSTVVDNKNGGSVDSDVRTSTGTFLAYRQDDIIARIEKRLALVTMIPEENGEALQVLRYVDGQKYEPHTDYFHDKVNSDDSHGGQRLATVLMYLTTPEEGGETVFPHAVEKPTYGEGWSECAKQGLAVKAKRGDALFFYSLKPDGSEDPRSTHGSCPTLKGEKFSATKWIHVRTFRTGGVVLNGPQGCRNDDERCEEWAILGECEKNAGYMLSRCRKACKACGPAQRKPSRDAVSGQKEQSLHLGRKVDPS